MLTEQQTRQFHEEGYLFLPETLLSAAEVAILKSEAEQIYRQQRPEASGARNPAPPGPRSPLTSTTKPMRCSPATR